MNTHPDTVHPLVVNRQTLSFAPAVRNLRLSAFIRGSLGMNLTGLRPSPTRARKPIHLQEDAEAAEESWKTSVSAISEPSRKF